MTGAGLKAWLANIKKLAADDTKRREMGSAAGRELQPAPPHISASFALMKKASLFLAERQKKPNNRYTAKPKGLEHLELQKTDDPSIAEFAGGGAGAAGQDMQDTAASIVREAKKTKRALHEEGMGCTAGKEKFTPQVKATESSDDRFANSMTAYFHADSLKTKQEALALLEERKCKKMETIERFQKLMQDETDDEMKALFKNQLKEMMKSLAALEAEEQVLTDLILMCFCMSQSLFYVSVPFANNHFVQHSSFCIFIASCYNANTAESRTIGFSRTTEYSASTLSYAWR